MNLEEQTVTWLISLGVLDSPKKNIADPEEFLKFSLKDGVVLCKLVERLQLGSLHKFCQDPRSEEDCLSNIREFLTACASLKIEGFDAENLYAGEDFGKVLHTLSVINITTQDHCVERSCTRSASQAHSQPSSSQRTSSFKGHKSPHRQSKNTEVMENGSQQVLVKARFVFKQTNEDELSFSKGDVISVTRMEEGGWWEGTLNGKTGWFPSNYVREIKATDKPISPKALKAFETPTLTKNYYNVVVQDILDNEREYAKELQTLLCNHLRTLQSSDKLPATDCASLMGNLEEIFTFQQNLCQSLEDCAKLSESLQRIGGCFMSHMSQLKSLYSSYCSNHPSAVRVLTEHSEELERLMESQGASSPGILTLTTSLSRPFMRLEKYPTLMQELERHVEESHPDHSDILKAMSAFKNLVVQCQDLRKRKNLELQILSEPIQGWEGESVKSLGTVLYMSQVMVQSAASEDKDERYFMLFPTVLLMLSASPRMSGFIYQGKLPLTGMTLTKQIEDGEANQYAFEIIGNMIDRITVYCTNQQDLHQWVEHLNSLTRGGSPGSTIAKSLEGRSGSVSGTPSHHTPSQVFSTSGSIRGPLEPLKIAKPWSFSCLRPAPPLKPSAALSYKERMSYILKESGKSPRTMKKFLPKRKTERKPSDDEFLLRKSTAALEEDAQILKVIEAYCTGASFHQNITSTTRKDSVPQVLLPEEEKIIIEETKSNGQTVIEEKSLVDAVYALKDEVHQLKKENKRMKQCLEEEQKSRKELEKLVKKLVKQKNDCNWEDTGH
ncbi:rho guanine nucleotide exchange factor 6 isoform X1 [Erpetoichthys calabaricus]|uniref:Rac/Cdc42 guanine nucleotide exchange factor 6 n=1 Tax=Erpetoichthys calabaricus TaxID=27687 RepID=A0A8C4SP81_ERPCA|nr:rho guanine nucleotide exchange factor 6 isoform X1 [Erpetoichthys calabaricus]